MTETEVKYLAGLIDADGSVGFAYTSNKVYLEISITAADSIDTKVLFIIYQKQQATVHLARRQEKTIGLLWQYGK